MKDHILWSVNNTKQPLRTIALMLSIVTPIGSCVAAQMNENETFNRLVEIMDVRKQLWFEPPPNGARDYDVSSVVCPVVSEDRLSEMYTELQGSGEVEYHNFVEANDSYPANTKLWTIKRPVGNGDTAFLDVTMTEGSICKARYQHIR